MNSQFVGLLDGLTADPWSMLRLVIGEPLHPGGADATENLLERASVKTGTRLLDVGCGNGNSLSVAREKGANVIGIDRKPQGSRMVRGDLTAFPVQSESIDVVLAECVLCLSPDLPGSLTEAKRVLRSGGRLALSDVIVEEDLPDIPMELAEPLCLTKPRSQAQLINSIEDAGFQDIKVQNHHKDLLALRDRAKSRIDYHGLLNAIGDPGKKYQTAIRTLEDAVETGSIGYVSIVACSDSSWN